MEFMKHKAGLILLILSLIVIISVIWYLLFGMSDGGIYDGGTLVEGIRDMKVSFACVQRKVMMSL